MNKKRLALGSSQGFTLIEVVLVLAIGGLIFLLAFIAFQQVSRNRRDTQRRSDAGRVLAEIANATADGFSITSANVNGTFKTNYLGTMEGPSNDSYELRLHDNATGPRAYSTANGEEMWIGIGQRCNNNAFAANAGSNAVIVATESGTSCRDDS